MGNYPYEGYSPRLQELCMLKDWNASMYMILWELACHFHICADVTGQRGPLFDTRSG